MHKLSTWLFLLFFMISLACQGPVLAEDQLHADIHKLAEQGDKEALFSLALRYDTGDGVERNPQLAASLFKEAAEAGVTGACFYLGMKYEFGAGIRQDKKKALHWYKQAALRGWPQAAFMLGSLYGRSTPPDKVRGCAWLTIAEKHGYPGAAASRQQTCSTLNQTEAGKTEELINKLAQQTVIPDVNPEN